MTTVITRSSKRKRVLPEGAVSAVILQGFLGSRFAACLTHVSLAALTAAYLAALIYLPFWIAFVPGILCAHRIGTLLHEYMHGIPFRRYRDNHAVVTLFDGGLLMFGTLEMFRVSHLQHHRWLNHEPDRTRGKSDTPGQRTGDVAAALQLFQYLGKFPAAISGAQPHVRRDRLLVSAILSIVTIWAWTAVGRPDVAWKMVVVTLATMLVPVSLRTAIEHHAAPGHPHFANEYRVWVPLFNLNRHIHHHEDPTIPWYRLQWRTQAPLSRSHYVSHWVHVHLKRDFVLMRPMRASDAAPRAVRPDRPKAVDVTSLQRPIRPSSEFDVAIIGGGINGACLYHALSAGGYRVLLVDRGDFASGTSQASTMMIWGGLLYLKDWELATVCSLSASRDRLIVRRPSQVRPRTIRYVPVAGGRSRVRVHSLLYAYWLLGGTRRPRPRFERDFEERAMLNQDGVAGALTYEEGGLEASDARFVLSWILHGGGPGCRARNYCALESATYDRSRREWRLDLSDTLDGGSSHAGARLVVNAAGGWTDRINAAAGIDSPYRHLLSRGVSIAVPRDPLHTTHLMFDKSVDRSAMAFAPWGPVGLWGSTDTVHADMERAGQADAADLQFLLDELNQHLAKPAGQRTGRRHALAHANGTLGLLAAFHALDLKPGDEVLVPSATFWASVLPMLWVGAVPVFCEIEGERFGLDPEDVERRITARTRAMVVVHLWGLPAKMTELLDIARRHDLRIIEDASHALGASWRGIPCGAFGDISVFSLQTQKLAPAGEGGMLLTDDETCHERAACLGDIVRILDLQTPNRRFAATSFGIKMRMAPMSAAVGRVQLRHADERNARRKANIEWLNTRLDGMGFDTFSGPTHVARVYFENLVRYLPEFFGGLPFTDLVAALAAEGCVVSQPRYPLVHQQPFFTEGHWKTIARLPDESSAAVIGPEGLPATVSLQQGMLRLPTFPSATPALLAQYADAFEKVRTWAIGRPEADHAREMA